MTYAPEITDQLANQPDFLDVNHVRSQVDAAHGYSQNPAANWSQSEVDQKFAAMTGTMENAEFGYQQQPTTDVLSGTHYDPEFGQQNPEDARFYHDAGHGLERYRFMTSGESHEAPIQTVSDQPVAPSGFLGAILGFSDRLLRFIDGGAR